MCHIQGHPELRYVFHASKEAKSGPQAPVSALLSSAAVLSAGGTKRGGHLFFLHPSQLHKSQPFLFKSQRLPEEMDHQRDSPQSPDPSC